MLQGGMGLNELVWWSDHGLDGLRGQLRRDVHPVRVDLPGRKRGRNRRPFYTFIGRDAVDALRVWMSMRPRGAGSIFTNQFGERVSKRSLHAYWTRHLHRLGIITRPENASARTRYGKNPHELRDLFRTRWQKSRADPDAAEFFMGHVIDPNGYNKAFRDQAYAEEQYLLAEPWLNIVTEDPEKVPRRDLAARDRKWEERYREQERMIRELEEKYSRLLEALTERS